MITKQELLFLNALDAAIHDKELIDIDMTKEDALYLFTMSQMHNVVPLMYDKIYQYLPQEIDIFFKQQTMQQTTLQIMKAEYFKSIYQECLKQEVKPLVFKGIICRSLYPKPDLRISGDEDLLIKKEELIKLDHILVNMGYERSESFHGDEEEIDYVQKNGSFLEVHTILFSNDSPYSFLNSYFEDVFDKSIGITIDGQDYYTFDYTKHLVYLFCHCYKHFLHGGFGLRQLCDIVIFMEHYHDKIDFHEVDQFMVTYSLDCLWYNLLAIATKYLGLNLKAMNYAIPEDRVDDEDLLKDLLDSGIYGASTKERKQSANMTLQAVNAKDASMVGSLWKSLFPSVSYIKTKYAYTKKHPILLPIGYMHRIISYIQQRNHSSNQSSVEIGKERIELLKKYKLIK